MENVHKDLGREGFPENENTTYKKKKHAGETEDIWGTIKRPN